MRLGFSMAHRENCIGMDMFSQRTFGTEDLGLTFTSLETSSADGPELRAAFTELQRRVDLRQVARQVVFLADDTQRERVDAVVREIGGPGTPPTTYVRQPPAGGSAVALEIWAFPRNVSVARKPGVATADMGGLRWLFTGGQETEAGEAPAEGVSRMLLRAKKPCDDAGVAFSATVRTWYYVGDLLEDHGGISRYDHFNRARNEFYRDQWPDLRLSPASTGIGQGSLRIAMESFAVTGGDGESPAVWLDNPIQTSPHLYSSSQGSRWNPAFSRGAAVRTEDAVLIFVSGTASIRDSEALHPGDVEAQTKATIGNIETLISRENLVGNHGLPRGAKAADLQQYRVYIKRPEDVDTVRSCCERLLPEAPALYLIADICRADLLMEIEGVAACAL